MPREAGNAASLIAIIAIITAPFMGHCLDLSVVTEFTAELTWEKPALGTNGIQEATVGISKGLLVDELKRVYYKLSVYHLGNSADICQKINVYAF